MSDPPAETTEKLKRAPGACYLFNNQNRRGHAVSLLLTSCWSCQNHAASLIRDIKARILLAPGRFHETCSTSESGSRVIRVERKNCRVHYTRIANFRIILFLSISWRGTRYAAAEIGINMCFYVNTDIYKKNTSNCIYSLLKVIVFFSNFTSLDSFSRRCLFNQRMYNMASSTKLNHDERDPHAIFYISFHCRRTSVQIPYKFRELY